MDDRPYIDKSTCPETEKPSPLKFRDRRCGEAKIDQILFALHFMKFHQEHVQTLDHPTGHQVCGGLYPQL